MAIIILPENPGHWKHPSYQSSAPSAYTKSRVPGLLHLGPSTCTISGTTRSIRLGMEAGEGGMGAKLDATSAGSDCMCRTYTMWLQEVMPHTMQMCKGRVNMQRFMPMWGVLLSRLTIIGRNSQMAEAWFGTSYAYLIYNGECHLWA